jgi:hypothetical protein
MNTNGFIYFMYRKQLYASINSRISCNSVLSKSHLLKKDEVDLLLKINSDFKKLSTLIKENGV